MRLMLLALGCATLIAVSIICAPLVSPYRIAPAVDADGNPFLWRVNAVTGDVQICPALRVIRDMRPTCQAHQ